MNIRSLDAGDIESIHAVQSAIYPSEMVESKELILSFLETSDLSRGAFVDGVLVGYFVVNFEDGEAELYDLGVHLDHQRRGVGSALVEAVFAGILEKRLSGHVYCRYTSKALFTNGRLAQSGFKVVETKQLPDFYFAHYGIHEDATYVRFQPS